MVYVADSMERARAEFRDPVLWYYRTISKYVAPAAGRKPVPTYEMYTAFRDLAAAASWEMLLEREAVICGEPDYVGERLAKYQEVYGFTELLCWTRLGGLDHRKVLRSMELMQDRVMPRLRASEPPPPPVG
jgi:alkanesulfonate monooxygenase SsuD/methylene tetrahydromethanopterin reductase-like flavin-dependent oxidoreductase (luciferase family)